MVRGPPVGVPTTPGQLPNGIAISPDGSSVYVTKSANDDNKILAVHGRGRWGTLTPMATPTVAAGAEPNEIVVSPDGHSAYVTNGATLGPERDLAVHRRCRRGADADGNPDGPRRLPAEQACGQSGRSQRLRHQRSRGRSTSTRSVPVGH